MATAVNWDIPLLVFLALASLRGFWRGFFRELGSLVGCLAGTVAGWKSASPIAEQLRGQVTGAASELDAALVFLAVFVGLWMLGGLLGWALEKLVRSGVWAWFSGAGGLVVGAVKGGVIAGALLLFVQLFAPQAVGPLQQAPVAQWILQCTSTAANWMIGRQGDPQ